VKILIDSDVLLDVALKRQPFFEHSADLLDRIQRGELDGFIAWHSISNLYFICSSTLDDQTVRGFLNTLFSFAKIAPVQTADILRALSLNMNDFEDAMQAAAALACGAELIATRNLSDYAKSPIKAYAPKDILKRI
jgi:predicted nucleic acid-binding protein